MAEAPQVVEIDPDFEPLPRPRSCTWPLPRPEFSQSNSATSSPAPSGGAAANPDGAAGLPSASAAAVNADFMSNLSLLEESGDFQQAPGSVAAAAAAAAAVAAAAAAAENPEPRAWSSPAFPTRSARPAQAASPHSDPGVLARPAQRGLGVPTPPRPGLGPPGPQCGG